MAHPHEDVEEPEWCNCGGDPGRGALNVQAFNDVGLGLEVT
jgi:hypothetical protein